MRLYIVKPIHKLNYSVGTDFCLEETSFSFTIVCRLENEPTPSPLPAFQWLTTFKSNETVDSITVTATVDTMYFENDTLIFSGDAIAELDRCSVLNVTCIATNNFGSDNATTSVKICGMINNNLHDKYFVLVLILRPQPVSRWPN